MENINMSDLISSFTNFTSALHILQQPVEDYMNRRKITDRSIAIEEIKRDLVNVSLNMRHLKGQFNNFRADYPNELELSRDLAILLLEEVEKARITIETIEDNEKRIEILGNIETNIKNVFLDVIQPVPTFKLRLNADKIVIYDLIRQLKHINIQSNLPFLSQSYEELANFFIQHVEGFENIKVKTLAKELGRENIIKNRHFSISTEG
jgi:hypothetical protein